MEGAGHDFADLRLSEDTVAKTGVEFIFERKYKSTVIFGGLGLVPGLWIAAEPGVAVLGGFRYG